jgi:hypothetical protein
MPKSRLGSSKRRVARRSRCGRPSGRKQGRIVKQSDSPANRCDLYCRRSACEVFQFVNLRILGAYRMNVNASRRALP